MQITGSDPDPRVHEGTVAAFTAVPQGHLPDASLLAPPSSTHSCPSSCDGSSGRGCGGEAWWKGPCAVRVIRVEARKQEYLKYFNTGDHSVRRGPSSYSERPVESELRHTGPTPTGRFSLGKSGLHCT